MADEGQEKSGVIQVRLKWGSSESLETIYVNQMTITHSGAEFYIVFGELPMPPILDESDVPEELEIKPKVRLALSPEAVRAISRAIQDNIKKFDSIKE